MFLNLLFSQDSKCHKNTAFFFSLFFFNFIFKLYIIVLVLPNIKMNPPQVYMCSPSWTLLQAFLNSLFSSVAQSYPTLCDPMGYSKPGLPVHHQLPEFTQTRVHWVGDAIQPSHPLSPSPPLTLNLSLDQGLFLRGFPGGSDSKESACNARDLGSFPGSGRSPGEGNGYPLQYSCLENSMDRGTWQATVLEVTKSRTQHKI